MSIINKSYSKRLIKGVAVFLAAVAVILCVTGIFMTRQGLLMLYPYVLAAGSEDINTADAKYSEYFILHKDVEEAGAIVLPVDLAVDGSYKLASDYFTFLSRFTDISSVAFYTSNARLRNISAAAVKGDYDEFSKYYQAQKKGKVMPDQYFLFLEKVYSVNTKQTPDKKIPITGFKGYTTLRDILNAMTSELLSSVNGFTGDHIEILGAKTPAEYQELLAKHEEGLKDSLGDKFSQYADTVDDVVNGTIEEAFALENLMQYAPPSDKGAVYIVAPRYLCGEDSLFIKAVEENYGKTVVTHTAYYNCETLDGEEKTALNDGKFPSFVDGIRIADAAELKGFRDHFEKSSGASGAADLGYAGRETFFIISGSGAVTYKGDPAENNTVGTVAVAPGQ